MPTATDEQIKTAYKKAALKWHPDRVPHDSPERAKRTKKFQAINDAYYTLSEKTRRKEYDQARQFHTASGGRTYTDEDDEDVDEEVPRASGAGGFPWSWFTGQGHASTEQADDFSQAQFQQPFEEMMDAAGLSEGSARQPTKRFWGITGAMAGGTLGFIVGNLVGAAAGAAAGHQLGQIRDKSGKSVYEVYQGLDQNSKARVLSELATKIFQGAIS